MNHVYTHALTLTSAASSIQPLLEVMRLLSNARENGFSSAHALRWQQRILREAIFGSRHTPSAAPGANGKLGQIGSSCAAWRNLMMGGGARDLSPMFVITKLRARVCCYEHCPGAGNVTGVAFSTLRPCMAVNNSNSIEDALTFKYSSEHTTQRCHWTTGRLEQSEAEFSTACPLSAEDNTLLSNGVIDVIAFWPQVLFLDVPATDHHGYTSFTSNV